ncbi:TonB family protein [Sphingomonas sp. JC676]|uniref:energy transducer TonB n=1 Tax=Sphingomonas sp. JC676 TaxID=2768065 RepID=UPI0016577A8E|nr:energy transducer TonB [Sphingomonas sp. JC676]MBC9033494.1 TonB family protein [Sphingomonas sp. JC676]
MHSGTWRSTFLLSMAGLGMPAAAQQADTAPLAPAGKWAVSSSDGGCLLSRSFGPGGTVSLAIRPLTGGSGTRLILVTQDLAKRERRGGATLVNATTGAKLSHDFETVLDADKTRRITQIRLKREELAPLDGAQAIAFRLEDQPAFELSVPGLDRARKTLDQCESLLMKSWGIEPGTIVKPPEPSVEPRTWVTNDDYPTEAMRRSDGGEVGFRLLVGTNGLVETCTVTQTSGSADLDHRACFLLTKRARFNPGLGTDGKPVKSIFASSFRFEIP